MRRDSPSAATSATVRTVPIRVVLGEDSLIVREGVQQLLGSDSDKLVLGLNRVGGPRSGVWGYLPPRRLRRSPREPSPSWTRFPTKFRTVPTRVGLPSASMPQA